MSRPARAPHAPQAHATVAHTTAAPTAEPPHNPFLALLAETQAVVSAPPNPFVALLAEASRPVEPTGGRLAELDRDGVPRFVLFREDDGSPCVETMADGRRRWFVICGRCGLASCSLSHWVDDAGNRFRREA